MAAFVLDASVLAALYVEDPASAAAERALTVLARDAALHAPELALLEVGNALWKRVGRGELQAQDGMAAIADLSAAPITFHGATALATQALALALAHGITVYDATYLALATRVGGTVVTVDRDLHRRAAAAGIPVADASELG